MNPSNAAATRPSFEMSIFEALVVEVDEDGDVLLRVGAVPEWGTPAIPVLMIDIGDRVLATKTSDGRLLVLGSSRRSQPTDDVVVRAPRGRIILDAGTDLELRAHDRVAIESPDVDLTADSASLHVREASIVADVIRTTADEVATTVGRWELSARRIVERAVDVVRAYEGVLHLTTGRAHTVVREAYDLVAKRTSIASEEDTTIDGKRVLLG